jgi:hypothetical protein
MAFTAEHKLTAREKILFGVLNTNLFSENNAKEPGLVPRTRTTKSQKNSGIFCQIAEFCGWIDGKTSPRPGNSGPWVRLQCTPTHAIDCSHMRIAVHYHTLSDVLF